MQGFSCPQASPHFLKSLSPVSILVYNPCRSRYKVFSGLFKWSLHGPGLHSPRGREYRQGSSGQPPGETAMVHAVKFASACRNFLLTISGLILFAVSTKVSAQSDVTGEWEIKMDR